MSGKGFLDAGTPRRASPYLRHWIFSGRIGSTFVSESVDLLVGGEDYS